MATLSDRVRRGDRAALEHVVRGALVPRADNLIERPWGSPRLLEHKGLVARPGRTYGEAFELAAHRGDDEARAHPSVLVLDDGSELELPALLDAAGAEVLGAALLAAHGAELPLLPKTLAIRELLSVQAHPPELPEVYVVLAADEGATLRLGLRERVDRAALERELREGLGRQEELSELLAPGADLAALQARLGPALLAPDADDARRAAALEPALAPGADRGRALELAGELARVSRAMLARMHALPVRAGTVIDNSRPATRPDRPSAELHGLGNPERREVLLLEVRRPGPTLRAWDHARFPRRRTDLAAALDAVDLRPTRPEDFLVVPRELEPGRELLVEYPWCAVERLRPQAELALASDGLETLHVTRGALELRPLEGRSGQARRVAAGASALVPAACPGVALAPLAANGELIRVRLLG